VDPLYLEVSKFSNIRELEVSPLGNMDPDCFVIGDNSPMQLYQQGSKVALDVLAVCLKLLLPMLEDEECSVDKRLPSDDPISMGFDCFGRCCRTMEELNVLAQLDGFMVVIGGGVDIGENMVEINGISAEEIEPLGLGELRICLPAVEEQNFSVLDVSSKIHKESLGFLKGGGELDHIVPCSFCFVPW
jgi:hypothetical protein